MILVLIPSLFLAIEASWRRPYLGDNAVEFVRALNDTCRSFSQRHSNTTFLIQSSGSGKSRMVDEASKLVFTIPTNVRNPEESSKRSTAIFVIEYPQ